MKKKIAQYENFLHQINIAANISMDNERLAQLIKQASDWSYAHRVGNGELTERAQKRIINKAFEKLGT